MIPNAFRLMYLPACLALLAGCTGQPSCGDSHPYLANTERAPLAAPVGVSVPAPDSAYIVPPAKSGASGQAGNCMVKPPDVLGPLLPSAASQVAPTITRHRHGKVIQETPSKPAPAPAAATQAAPAVATRAPME